VPRQWEDVVGFGGIVPVCALPIVLYFGLRSRWIRRHPTHAHPTSPVSFGAGVASGVSVHVRNRQYADLFREANQPLLSASALALAARGSA
jgi:hypothetical protein